MDTCFPRLKNVLRWVQLAGFVLFGVVAGFEFFNLRPRVGCPPPVSVLTMARSFALSPLGAELFGNVKLCQERDHARLETVGSK